MANFLPVEYQKEIRRTLYARLLIALSLVALICAGCAFALLLPGYIMVRFGVSGNSAVIVKTPSTGVSDSASIARARLLSDQLSVFVQATSTPTEILLLALSAKPADLSIDHILYSAALPKGSGQVTLSGTSQKPESVGVFRDTLMKDKHFTRVDVPVAALVGSTQGGTFTVTLTGDF